MAENETKKKKPVKVNNKEKNKDTVRSAQEKKTNTKKSTEETKKNSSSKTTSSTKNAEKSEQSTTKKGTSKKATSSKKKASTKKASSVKKADSSKKIEKKKIEGTSTKKEIKDTTKKVTEDKESFLERTIIFDGTQSKNLNEVVERLEEDRVVLDDKIIPRSKARKVIIIILAILMVLIFVITTVYISKEIASEKRVKATLSSDIYNKASERYKSESDIKESEKSDLIKDIEYDNIETITLSDFERKALNKEDMIVLVASTTCYSCITFEPVVDEVFKSLDKTIYRINISSMSKEDIDMFRTYYAFKSTPTIFVIKDGYVIADVRGAMTKENLEKWLDENL